MLLYNNDIAISFWYQRHSSSTLLLYNCMGWHCFKNKLQTIFVGTMSNTHHSRQGGGVNFQCMPLTPEFDTRSASGFSGSYMYGTEYEISGTGIFPRQTNNQNVPCARCYTNQRSAHMMIPGKRSCPTSWTKEYEGAFLFCNSCNFHTHLND